MFRSWSYLNPYWQILENSSGKFAEISVFWDFTQMDFLENSSIKILWVPFKFLLNIGTWVGCPRQRFFAINSVGLPDFLQVDKYDTIIRPNRIYLPSPCSQWRKYEREKRKISSTGGVVRADLFYWDRLYQKTRGKTRQAKKLFLYGGVLWNFKKPIIENSRFSAWAQNSLRSSNKLLVIWKTHPKILKLTMVRHVT